MIPCMHGYYYCLVFFTIIIVSVHPQQQVAALMSHPCTRQNTEKLLYHRPKTPGIKITNQAAISFHRDPGISVCIRTHVIFASSAFGSREYVSTNYTAAEPVSYEIHVLQLHAKFCLCCKRHVQYMLVCHNAPCILVREQNQRWAQKTCTNSTIPLDYVHTKFSPDYYVPLPPPPLYFGFNTIALRSSTEVPGYDLA